MIQAAMVKNEIPRRIPEELRLEEGAHLMHTTRKQGCPKVCVDVVQGCPTEGLC